MQNMWIKMIWERYIVRWHGFWECGGLYHPLVILRSLLAYTAQIIHIFLWSFIWFCAILIWACCRASKIWFMHTNRRRFSYRAAAFLAGCDKFVDILCESALSSGMVYTQMVCHHYVNNDRPYNSCHPTKSSSGKFISLLDLVQWPIAIASSTNKNTQQRDRDKDRYTQREINIKSIETQMVMPWFHYCFQLFYDRF